MNNQAKKYFSLNKDESKLNLALEDDKAIDLIKNT